MSKSTKIITSVVAIALVVAAMVVGIYAATAGSATITANVSWQATAGLEFTLTGNADNNNGSTKTTGAIIVDTTTTNEVAGNLVSADKNLNIDFGDADTDDGVNTAQPINFEYVITNNSASVDLVVKLTAAPTTSVEKNVTVTSATAKLASAASTDVYAQLTGADTSVTVPTGDTLTITIIIDVTNDNAAVEGYNAGVTFSFAK